MMAYANVDELIEYLGITTYSDNVLLDSLLTRAQTAIDTYTSKTFEAGADTTQTFDADRDVDGALLHWSPYNLWLASITSVTNGDSTTVTAAQYVTEPRHAGPYYGIRLLASTSLAWEYPTNGDPENAISIVGRWAYSTTPPADIVHATLRLSAYLYRQRDNLTDIDRPIFAGNATILPIQLPADVRLLLDPYRERL